MLKPIKKLKKTKLFFNKMGQHVILQRKHKNGSIKIKLLCWNGLQKAQISLQSKMYGLLLRINYGKSEKNWKQKTKCLKEPNIGFSHKNVQN